MKTFKHHNARSLKQAASLLSKYNGKARVNAGGTDLIGESEGSLHTASILKR